MDGFISGYTSITTAVVTALQKLGLLTLPLGIAVAAITGFLGGERAIRAVAITIGAMGVLTLVLNSAVAIGQFIGQAGH